MKDNNLDNADNFNQSVDINTQNNVDLINLNSQSNQTIHISSNFPNPTEKIYQLQIPVYPPNYDFQEKSSENKNNIQEIESKKNSENEINELNSKIVYKNKFSNVLKNSSILFLKVYSGRILFSLFQFFSRSKLNYNLKNFLKVIFNLGNLRTSLMVSSMPLTFEVLKRFLFKILKITNMDLLTFISGFLSSYIAICLEKKSKLLSYIVLAIAVRVVHSMFIIKYKDSNRFQGTFWDFTFFLGASVLMIFTNFLNPSFQPITSLFDSYANYINQAEKDQMNKMREIFRIV